MVTGRQDRIVDTVVAVLLVVVGLVALVPLLVVVSASLTPYSEILSNGGYVLLPRDITFDGYIGVWTGSRIPRAMAITVFITVVGTLINMVLTVLMAYPLSQKELPGRRAILLLLLFTTIFSAGIIPTYLVVQATGLLNTVWAMIIPSAMSVFNVLIMKTFFEGLPRELLESARIDGAGEFKVLFRIVLPLSVPVLLTIGLFYSVGNWNTFMNAVLYVRDIGLQPLQVVVRDLLANDVAVTDPDSVTPTVTVRMAAVVISALPIVLVYPFVQKYFQKGVLLGSVKS